MSSRNNRLNKYRRLSDGRMAVLTHYGSREHIECIAVAIQEGGIKSGGRMLDSRLFWSHDYPSGEELTKSVLAWVNEQGAVAVGQIDEVFPIQEGRLPSARVMN